MPASHDVVNPDARNNQGSPIYGMPILNVDQSQAVIVLKRSMNPGFAGIDNPLFVEPNTLMLFGDAKESVEKLTAEVKALWVAPPLVVRAEPRCRFAELARTAPTACAAGDSDVPTEWADLPVRRGWADRRHRSADEAVEQGRHRGPHGIHGWHVRYWAGDVGGSRRSHPPALHR